MRFPVDAHLPPSLCALVESAGHDVLHTRQLAAQHLTLDQAINEISARGHHEGRRLLLFPPAAAAAPQAAAGALWQPPHL
ncbi:MAG: DUF5615 family PIN-like protein [Verrucomicrobia bacterium]|nr:DUF5615 family PIN-like protein [Verrucomicrobiota bacterium]